MGLVSDICLMPGLSAELQEVAWLGEATGPAVGHRFTGRNANAYRGTWETVSTVVECDAPRRFTWAVGDPGHPMATWRFTLRPDGAGTVLEQWARMGPARSGLSLAIDAMPDKEQKIVFVRLRETRPACGTTWPSSRRGPNGPGDAHRNHHRGLVR